MKEGRKEGEGGMNVNEGWKKGGERIEGHQGRKGREGRRRKEGGEKMKQRYQ